MLAGTWCHRLFLGLDSRSTSGALGLTAPISALMQHVLAPNLILESCHQYSIRCIRPRRGWCCDWFVTVVLLCWITSRPCRHCAVVTSDKSASLLLLVSRDRTEPDSKCLVYQEASWARQGQVIIVLMVIDVNHCKLTLSPRMHNRPSKRTLTLLTGQVKHIAQHC